MSENLKRSLIYILLGLLVVIALPLLGPLLIGSVVTTWLNKRSFKRRYKNFLDACDEMLFFCYSDRFQKQDIIEQHILPTLDPDINIIYIQGREPQSEFDSRYIAYLLDHLQEQGCPNLIRVSNGRIINRNLQKAMKETLPNDPVAFAQIIRDKHSEIT